MLIRYPRILHYDISNTEHTTGRIQREESRGSKMDSDFPPCREQLWDKSISHGFHDLQLCAVYFSMTNVSWGVKYAWKCILYGFPSEMDFSPLISESHPRRKRLGWEKNPSHLENHTKCTNLVMSPVAAIKVYTLTFEDPEWFQVQVHSDIIAFWRRELLFYYTCFKSRMVTFLKCCKQVKFSNEYGINIIQSITIFTSKLGELFS